VKHLIATIVAAVVLSCCAHHMGDEYGLQPDIGTPLSATTTRLGSEQCQALRAVIEERERYGIVAPSQGMDEAALGRCGLPHGGGSGSLPQTLPYPRYAPSAPLTSGSAIAAPLSAGVAGMCPTPQQFLTFWRCIDDTTDPHQVERCAVPWGADRLWACGRDDPALSNLTVNDLRAATASPPPAPPMPVSPPPASSLTCGPQLTLSVARQVEQTNPGIDPAVRTMAIQKALEMLGCLPASPPQQTTNCWWVGNMLSCTTR
jgi:hypothetical protein